MPSVPWTISGVKRVGDDPAGQDPGARLAEGPRRSHVVQLLDGQDGGAHDPGIDGYGHDPDRELGIDQTGAERGHDPDRQQQAGEGQHDVHEPHQDVVEVAAHVPGHGADEAADDDREADGQEADLERDAAGEDDPAEHVPEVAVRAHEVLRLVRRAAQGVDARRRAALDAGLDWAKVLTLPEGRDLLGEDRHQDDDQQDRQADDRVALAEDVAKRCPSRATTSYRRRAGR